MYAAWQGLSLICWLMGKYLLSKKLGMERLLTPVLHCNLKLVIVHKFMENMFHTYCLGFMIHLILTGTHTCPRLLKKYSLIHFLFVQVKRYRWMPARCPTLVWSVAWRRPLTLRWRWRYPGGPTSWIQTGWIYAAPLPLLYQLLKYPPHPHLKVSTCFEIIKSSYVLD